MNITRSQYLSANSTPGIVSQLLECGLINSTEADLLLQSPHISELDILEHLARIPYTQEEEYEIRVLSGTDIPLVITALTPDEIERQLQEQSRANWKNRKIASEEDRNRFREHVQTLLQLRLIDNKTAFLLYQWVDTSDILHRRLLLNQAAGIKQYLSFFHPDVLQPLAALWLEIGLISDDGYRQLLLHAETPGFTRSSELFAYVANARKLNTERKDEYTYPYLEDMHRQAAALIPGLIFAPVAYHTLPGYTPEGRTDIVRTYDSFKDLLTSIEIDGKIYSHRSRYMIGTMYDVPEIDVWHYYKVFNNVLRDRGTDYRLHLIVTPISNLEEQQGYWLIGLTRSQYTELVDFNKTQNYRHLEILYPATYDEPSEERITEVMEIYRSVGLLKHLSDEEAELAVERVHHVTINTINDIAEVIPGAVFIVDNDSILAEIEEAFTHEVHRLCAFLREDFPIEITTDTYHSETLHPSEWRFAYTFCGKDYALPCPTSDNEAFDGIVALINTTLEEHNYSGRLYYIKSNRYDQKLMYLTPDQHTILQQTGAIEFAELM